MRLIIGIFILVSFPLNASVFLSDLSGEKISIKKVLRLRGKAVPLLINTIKNPDSSDRQLWVSTISLGKVAGKKASKFLVRLLEHPNWVLRLASLKTLLALKEKRYTQKYVRALKDSSLLVRKQALENIKRLRLKQHATKVWAMIFDKSNYAGKLKKRMDIVGDAIKVVGILGYKSAFKPLLVMAKKEHYRDIHPQIKFSLAMLAKKN